MRRKIFGSGAKSDKTKIPLNSLRAIEADDYESLPAEAFAHGFYTIYANFLGLDVDHILKIYRQNKKLYGKDEKHTPVPGQLHNQIRSMAIQPSIGPGTIFGFGLVLLVIIGALISYFVDWNPASYLSKKIRSNVQVASLNQNATTSKTRESEKNKYHLQAHFPSITKVTVIKDDEQPGNYLFQAGDTRSWMAQNNITMILPEQSKVRLIVNGLVHPLPEPQYGIITVTIP